jgi:hypothetical protein
MVLQVIRKHTDADGATLKATSMHKPPNSCRKSEITLTFPALCRAWSHCLRALRAVNQLSAGALQGASIAFLALLRPILIGEIYSPVTFFPVMLFNLWACHLGVCTLLERDLLGALWVSFFGMRGLHRCGAAWGICRLIRGSR